MISPIVPTLAVTPKENAELQQARLQAQADAMERLGADKPNSPVALSEVRTRLRVHERCADGAVRATVFVEVAGQKQRYVRSLRIVTRPESASKRTVRLRLG